MRKLFFEEYEMLQKENISKWKLKEEFGGFVKCNAIIFVCLLFVFSSLKWTLYALDGDI